MQVHLNKADAAITIVAMVDKTEPPLVNWSIQASSLFYQYKGARWESAETPTQHTHTLTLKSIWAADDIIFWMRQMAFEIGFRLQHEQTNGQGEIDRATCSYTDISYFVNGLAMQDAKAVEAALAGPTQWHDLGSFQLKGDTLRATDPAYGRDTWCTHTFKALSGDWLAQCLIGPTDWHHRVKELRIYHKSVNAGLFLNVDLFKDVGHIGVDSAQCGFFDDMLYPDRSEDGRDDSAFYRNCCDITGDKALPGSGVIDAGFGVVSSSGYGDGGYSLLVCENECGQAIAAMIRFIEDSEESQDSEA